MFRDSGRVRHPGRTLIFGRAIGSITGFDFRRGRQVPTIGPIAWIDTLLQGDLKAMPEQRTYNLPGRQFVNSWVSVDGYELLYASTGDGPVLVSFPGSAGI